MEDVAETVQFIVRTNIWKPPVQLIDHDLCIVLGKRLSPIPAYLFQVSLHVGQIGND